LLLETSLRGGLYKAQNKPDGERSPLGDAPVFKKKTKRAVRFSGFSRSVAYHRQPEHGPPAFRRPSARLGPIIPAEELMFAKGPVSPFLFRAPSVLQRPGSNISGNSNPSRRNPFLRPCRKVRPPPQILAFIAVGNGSGDGKAKQSRRARPNPP